MEDTEEWKCVVGYEEKYIISSYGRMKNIRTGIILKLTPNRDGYCRLKLIVNGKRKSVPIHRLVGYAFFDPSSEHYGNVINHKDGIKHNNKVSNLEWCNTALNNRHAIDTGLIRKKINASQALFIKSAKRKHKLYEELSKQFGIAVSTVRLIRKGKSWTHLNYAILERKKGVA